MTLYEERAKECFDIFAQLINISEDTTYDFEGNKIQLNKLIPMMMKHIFRAVMRYENRSEAIFNWMVDAIQYVQGFTDTPPYVQILDSEDEVAELYSEARKK